MKKRPGWPIFQKNSFGIVSSISNALKAFYFTAVIALQLGQMEIGRRSLEPTRYGWTGSVFFYSVLWHLFDTSDL